MIEVQSNVSEIIEDFKQLTAKARYLLSSQILADANKHARMDTGELIRSSQRASNLVRGELVWDTDYAKKVYYTGRPSHDTNPDAQLMWVDFARDRYIQDWMVIFARVYEKYN